MIRLPCLALIVILASSLAVSSQQKEQKDKPKEFTNNLGMKFVWVPPGTFMMGSPKGEQVFPDEVPQHKVTLTKGFYMGVYLVTQEQWQAIMGNNPSKFQGEKNLPVDKVSWNDCQEFIKKLREKDKKTYRLPTEAEWEYAYRAGTTTPFYCGNTISSEQANYNGAEGNSRFEGGKKGVYRKKTTPVGSFPANPFGLYDMAGNLYQWCEDWLGNYPNTDQVDPRGPETGKQRISRGGAWVSSPHQCRAAYRYWNPPGNAFDRFGFRICFSAE